MWTHISKIMQVCFYKLQRLRQIRCLLGRDVTASLVAALILSRLDYCNALLAAPQPQSCHNESSRLQRDLCTTFGRELGFCSTGINWTTLVADWITNIVQVVSSCTFSSYWHGCCVHYNSTAASFWTTNSSDGSTFSYRGRFACSMHVVLVRWMGF